MGLSKNDQVETVTAANCDITDSIGHVIAKCLQSNKALKFLTLDSNSLSGDLVIQLIMATAPTKTLEELRVSNQVLTITRSSLIIVRILLLQDNRNYRNRSLIQSIIFFICRTIFFLSLCCS